MEPRVEPRVGGLRATVREGKKVNAVRVLHPCHPLGWAGGTGPRARRDGEGQRALRVSRQANSRSR